MTSLEHQRVGLGDAIITALCVVPVVIGALCLVILVLFA